MNEDAIAPVIAVMLLLAIAVTFFSVFTTTYLPALKQQAEVEHLQQVESGFLKFSSDIDHAMFMKSEGILSEQIPLGGGDILVNSLKSSGTIRIQEEQYPYLIIKNESGEEYPLYIVNYSYSPIGNFWVDQGYTWQYGYVNITKGTRSTPLQDYTMDESDSKMRKFIRALISIPPSDGKNLIFNTVSYSECKKNFSSGNGIAQISLNATKLNSIHYNKSTGFSFSINRKSPLNATLCEYLRDEMTKKPGMSVNAVLTGSNMDITVTPVNQVDITINELQIVLETQ